VTSEAPFFGAELLQNPGIESLERIYKKGRRANRAGSLNIETTIFILFWE
jgi:hypothetical protein